MTMLVTASTSGVLFVVAEQFCGARLDLCPFRHRRSKARAGPVDPLLSQRRRHLPKLLDPDLEVPRLGVIVRARGRPRNRRRALELLERPVLLSKVSSKDGHGVAHLVEPRSKPIADP